jgi:hypothetical protein
MINIGVFRRTGCRFYLRSGGTSPEVVYDGFGLTTDRDEPRPAFDDGRGLFPLAGDWTGKGFDSIGVYRDGKFCLRNSNTPGAADLEIAYGIAGDIPLVGNWTGKGFDSIGVYRSSEAKFYLRYSNTPGVPDEVINHGSFFAGNVPLVGDWTGKGFDSIGVYEPTRNGGTFNLRLANESPLSKPTWITYGNPGDVPVVGDWTGKGFDSIGVYRPGESKFYLRNSNTPGNADTVIQHGNPGDIPLVGNWG